MPELPEVQTVVDTLRPRVVGRTIARVRLVRKDIVTPANFDLACALSGQLVSSIERRGKRIVFALARGDRFYIHLGMTGRLTVQARSAPVAPHTHLVLELSRPTVEIRFTDPRRFGGVWWLGRAQPPDHDIGPEPLRARPAQLVRRLAKTTRAIKNALLDQRVLAGLGNIYVDESLFAAAIHPLARADALSPEQIRRLSRAIKSTLRRALRHRGSTLRDYRDADGAPGAFQSLHRVYDREGKPCRRCNTPIQRTVLGGRSTHFCPGCQQLGTAFVIS